MLAVELAVDVDVAVLVVVPVGEDAVPVVPGQEPPWVKILIALYPPQNSVVLAVPSGLVQAVSHVAPVVPQTYPPPLPLLILLSPKHLPLGSMPQYVHPAVRQALRQVSWSTYGVLVGTSFNRTW